MHNLTRFLVTWGKQRGRVIDMEPSFLIQGPAMWTRAVAHGERTGGNKKDIQEVISSGFAVSWKLRVTSTRQIVTLLTKVEGGRGWAGLPEE